MLQGLLSGAQDLGLCLEDPLEMTASAVKGTMELILSGEEPSALRDRIATSGGGTEQSIIILNEMKIESSFGWALKATTEHNIHKSKGF
jgi:pyrroline-5-carboxylate reductase